MIYVSCYEATACLWEFADFPNIVFAKVLNAGDTFSYKFNMYP